MRNLHDLPRVRLGVFPTPFYRLDRLSEQYGRGIWIKRDDLCGVALGGSKVRKLEFVLAEALDQGCDTVFTTGGAQSNHAALTAACAARLGMKCILLLKRRGVTEHRGNLVLDELFGAEVRLLDMDSYDEIYAEMLVNVFLKDIFNNFPRIISRFFNFIDMSVITITTMRFSFAIGFITIYVRFIQFIIV